MLCDICKKNEATSHFKKILGDKVTEAHLCSECARTHGYGSMLGAFTFDFNNFLSGFFGYPSAISEGKKETEVHCPECSVTYSEIVKDGKVGCAQCYNTFSDMLLPSIRRIHGESSHVGKFPLSAGAKARAKAEIAVLKNELGTAIEAQEFEKAAELRDKIREIEGGEKNVK